MKLTEKTLEKIACDSDIKLEGTEMNYYLKEINKIVDLFEEIKEVDTTQIQPCHFTQHQDDFLEEARELKKIVSEYLLMPQVVLE